MLTLKFCKTDYLNRHVETSLTCARVEVIHCEGGSYVITAYPILNHDEGTEFRLSTDEKDRLAHHTCFVINESGKTVDRYSAAPQVESE